MKIVISSILFILAVIHLLPVAGVLGSDSLTRLYGISVSDSNTEILLRHRAVLFAIIGLFLLLSVFSKNIKPGLVIAYAGLEGLALGTLSSYYESFYPGIVSQAVIGTVATFAGVLIMYRNGTLRATPQFTRAVIGAAIGYFILGLASLIASFFGVGQGYGFYGLS